MHQRITSRRKFLKETILGATLLSAAKFIPSSILFAGEFTKVPNDLLYFSPKEYLIIEAIAERIIGESHSGQPTSTDLGVAARADGFLAGADQEVQEQFHQLLTVFNAPFFAFLFDFRTSSFLGMASTDQDSYLKDWMTSKFGFRRTGFQAMKRVCLSMFYTERRSWKEIGYEGMFLPEDRK